MFFLYFSQVNIFSLYSIHTFVFSLYYNALRNLGYEGSRMGSFECVWDEVPKTCDEFYEMR